VTALALFVLYLQAIAMKARLAGCTSFALNYCKACATSKLRVLM